MELRSIIYLLGLLSLANISCSTLDRLECYQHTGPNGNLSSFQTDIRLCPTGSICAKNYRSKSDRVSFDVYEWDCFRPSTALLPARYNDAMCNGNSTHVARYDHTVYSITSLSGSVIYEFIATCTCCENQCNDENLNAFCRGPTPRVTHSCFVLTNAGEYQLNNPILADTAVLVKCPADQLCYKSARKDGSETYYHWGCTSQFGPDVQCGQSIHTFSDDGETTYHICTCCDDACNNVTLGVGSNFQCYKGDILPEKPVTSTMTTKANVESTSTALITTQVAEVSTSSAAQITSSAVVFQTSETMPNFQFPTKCYADSSFGFQPGIPNGAEIRTCKNNQICVKGLSKPAIGPLNMFYWRCFDVPSPLLPDLEKLCSVPNATSPAAPFFEMTTFVLDESGITLGIQFHETICTCCSDLCNDRRMDGICNEKPPRRPANSHECYMVVDGQNNDSHLPTKPIIKIDCPENQVCYKSAARDSFSVKYEWGCSNIFGNDFKCGNEIHVTSGITEYHVCSCCGDLCNNITMNLENGFRCDNDLEQSYLEEETQTTSTQKSRTISSQTTERSAESYSETARTAPSSTLLTNVGNSFQNNSIPSFISCYLFNLLISLAFICPD